MPGMTDDADAKGRKEEKESESRTPVFRECMTHRNIAAVQHNQLRQSIYGCQQPACQALSRRHGQNRPAKPLQAKPVTAQRQKKQQRLRALGAEHKGQDKHAHLQCLDFGDKAAATK